MHRPNGPKPAWLRPLRPADDAVSSWLAFHAYRLAVGVFVQGRDAGEVARTELAGGGALGDSTGRNADPTAPLGWDDVRVEIDRDRRTVSLHAPDGSVRSAMEHGQYGCVILAPGEDAPRVERREAPAPRPAPAAPWPHGGEPDRSALPDGADLDALDKAADAVVGDGGGRAFLAVHRGRLIAESYAPGYDRSSRLAGWSMTKSLIGGMVGRAIQEGLIGLHDPLPVPEWQGDGDPRAGITFDHLMHMSSGLDCANGLTPWAHGDRHFVFYSGTDDVYRDATGLEPLAEPGTRAAYQNCDPILAATVLQRVVADAGGHPADAPWSLLFDPLGMESVVLHADTAGNYILSGFSAATAQDWARFGQLYLDDGCRDGVRLLPQGWLDYAMAPSPADTEPVYGGALMWLGHEAFGEQMFGRPPHGNRLPRHAFGAGHYGQRLMIFPEQELVLVRMGHGVDDALLADTALTIIDLIQG